MPNETKNRREGGESEENRGDEQSKPEESRSRYDVEEGTQAHARAQDANSRPDESDLHDLTSGIEPRGER